MVKQYNNKKHENETNEELTELIREDIDMPKIVMMHILQISRILSKPDFNRDQFNANIMFLKGLLSPVFDNDFKNDTDKILAIIKAEKNKIYFPGYNRIKYEERKNNIEVYCENLKSQLLFEALCKLAQRVGVSWEKEDMADFDV